MTAFAGSTLMAIAVILGIAYGGYILWRKGKLTRLTFLPKPPTTTETK